MRINAVPQAQALIDEVLAAARKKGDQVRGTLPGKTRLEKSRHIELEKIQTVHKRLNKHLDAVLKNYPSLDTLPEYQKELLYLLLPYEELKKGLGAVRWARNRINTLYTKHKGMIRASRAASDVNQHRTAFFGRVCSTLKQVKTGLHLLESARNTLNDFPTVDTDLPIICIAGFPNVGKSTLLKKITGSNVKIDSYAFTTKRLNVGSITYKNSKIQFIDTPGTLNRDKMNPVETQAHIALKYLADHIIYVFDPTPTYSLDKQKKLLTHMKRYRKPLTCYMSKTDIAEHKEIDAVHQVTTCFTNVDELVTLMKKVSKTIKQ